MKKKFNVTGTCVSDMHYMVDVSNKLEKIKDLIDEKEYFTINRARQYGKTTTLSQLRRFLADEYTVILTSFEGLGDESFKDEATFCQTFLELIYESFEFSGIALEEREIWQDSSVIDFKMLSRYLTKVCKDKAWVLMIDEVDQASNHRIFLNFLGVLRKKFLASRDGLDFTFHSVILAGLYDIKNLRIRMIEEGVHIPTVGERIYNSPWNIAINFKIDMSFNPEEIVTMLSDYEQDYQTRMNVIEVAEEIHFYTNGYPVLVSGLCQYIDVELGKNWSQAGVKEAVRLLVRETDSSLFKSLSQNLEEKDEVYRLMYDILILGERRNFSTDNPAVDLAYRYAYIRDDNGRVKVSNKVFEIRMTDYFISKDEGRTDVACSGGFIPEITRGNRFNMELCLERFMVHWQEIYNDKSEKFLEKECRMIFLMYLKPLLNGVGFYYIETALSDDRRMDLVVTYETERFVLELKIWKGQLYNEEGVEQLKGYMDKFNEEKGYLLTFDFRKNPVASTPNWRAVDGKKIFEVRV